MPGSFDRSAPELPTTSVLEARKEETYVSVLEKWIDISSDGKLVEDIFWSQLETEVSALTLPDTRESDLRTIVDLDKKFRLELEASVRDEAGNWIGAAWPIAVSLLVPKPSGAH